MAYKHIRNKQIDQDREWLIRNYALTFAGVMLRVWNPLFSGLGIDFASSYIVVSWLCWVPNLALAEFVIRRNRRRPQRGVRRAPTYTREAVEPRIIVAPVIGAVVAT